MGGAAFSCLPRYGWCVPKHSTSVVTENKNHKTSTPHRANKGHRRDLSAAFNLCDLEQDNNVEAVNLNTSTEEELMTLPGINRQIAHNIIEYRAQIGGFRRVEDLALVSGVGASKLGVLRSEVSVGNKKSSLNSSLNSIQHDVSGNVLESATRNQDNSSRTSSQASTIGSTTKSIINLNTSNVFQLMRIKGITQQVAENIVMHRDRKGAFKSLNDLIKVKGINAGLLSAIRPSLALHDPTISSQNTSQNSHNASRRKNSATRESMHSNIYPSLNDFSSSRKIDSQEDLCSIYGPLGRRSVRRPKSTTSDALKPENGILRVATWNLQQCSLEKAENPGVKEVFAMTLLEKNISIIAVQELRDSQSLQKLCDELNSPTIPNVRKWAGSRGVWKCTTSPPAGRMFQGVEHLGFAWDASRGIELKTCDLLENDVTSVPLARRPFLAVFQMEHYDLALVTLHLKCPGLDNAHMGRLEGEVDSLSDVINTVRAHTESEKEVMLLGDFNVPPDIEEFSSFGELGYSNVFHRDQYTNISTRNPEGSVCLDNIWVGERLQGLQTGHAEVIRDGLSSPWIPDGWGWGGMLSDHCPVYVEIRSKEVKKSHTRRVEDVNIALKITAGGSA